MNIETPSNLEEKTSIRLSLGTSPESYMCQASSDHGSSYVDLIPALEAPQGVMVQGTGAGSSDRDADVRATLKGDLSAAELADFYKEQLIAARWNLQNEGDGEGGAWSRWAFQDEQGTDWIGALMVIDASTENDTLFAMLTIEKKN